MVLKPVFWTSLGLILYTYAGYHLIVKLLATLLPERKRRTTFRSQLESISVSIIVAVHNEERVIQRRIENLLELDYPREKLEIIVASDGSTDRTNEIAERYKVHGITVLNLNRVGKALVHNAAVPMANGRVIVFTDAETEFDRDFISVVARYFAASAQIGCVVGNLIWKDLSTATSKFRELTWKLETDLRRVEGRLGILAGASGAAMAVRKDLWKPMRDAFDDSDSLTPLDVILQGYQVAFAPDAVAYEVPFASASSDFRAKVRSVSRSIVMIPRRWRPIEWAAHPLIMWRTISHHVLRWVAPYCILVFVVSSCCLLNAGVVYCAAFVFEIMSGLLALLAYLSERANQRSATLGSMILLFSVINSGLALGLLKGVTGRAPGPFEKP